MKKYKIGYTTGVFDMFHIGHLNILKSAKEQCENLIVGVSTDELVKEYKNKTPIICFQERYEIVKSLKFVDKVIVQENMDKLQAWKELRFNAIFHGDDWKNSDIYNDYIKQFKEVGVDVVFLPHTEGTSSTKLAGKLDSIE